MKFVGRLALATMLLISQMSWATVLCACAPLQQPAPKAAASCPVSGEKNCACCLAGKGPRPDSEVKAGSPCQIHATAAGPGQEAVFAFAAAFQAVLPAAPIELPRALPAPDRSTPAHLAVPRIRPPNSGVHGLRAPPVR